MLDLFGITSFFLIFREKYYEKKMAYLPVYIGFTPFVGREKLGCGGYNEAAGPSIVTDRLLRGGEFSVHGFLDGGQGRRALDGNRKKGR
ncbi:MAG: hypothetical protein OEY01_07215 [Desulfobulbaceae bacterium]|nr:hypothetical protein [Desulfobulbaceae bacterium]